MELDIIRNIEKNRYEAFLGQKIIGVITYHFLPGFVLAVTSTEIRSKYKEQGVASLLIKNLLEYARFNNYKISPECPQVKAYIAENGNYKDLLIEADSVTDFEVQ